MKMMWEDFVGSFRTCFGRLGLLLCLFGGCGELWQLPKPADEDGRVKVVGVHRAEVVNASPGAQRAQPLPASAGSDLMSETASSLGEPSKNSGFVGIDWLHYGKSLVSVDRQGEVLRWKVDGGGKTESLGYIQQKPLLVAFAPERSLLGLVTREQAAVYSLNPLRQLAAISIEHHPVAALAFEAKGEALLLGGMDGSVLRWLWGGGRTAGALPIERYLGPSALVSSLASHPSKRVFFAGDWSGVLNAWLIYSADEFEGAYDRNILRSPIYVDRAERMSGGKVTGATLDVLALTRDGGWLAIGAASGEVFVWKVRGFREVAKVVAHVGGVQFLGWGSDNKTLVSAGRDGAVRFWSLVSEGFDATELKKEYSLVSVAEAEVRGVSGLVVGQGGEAFVATDSGTIISVTP